MGKWNSIVTLSGDGIHRKSPRRKLKDLPTIHVIKKIVDLMLGKTITPKYNDHGSPIVTFQIKHISIPNTLVDIG